MNICIVTVYNSENCGSYYQALALKTILERQGHEVFFLRRYGKSISHRKDRSLKAAASALRRGHFQWALECLSIYQNFEKKICSLPVIDMREMGKIDAIVIGSDTLWNLESPHFREWKQVYSGLSFPNKQSITYAVSIANTPKNTILEDLVMREGIAKLSVVSVRDEATRAVVQKIRGESPLIVVDPTLLLDLNDYAKYEKEISEHNYILIYSFGTLSENEKQQILKYKSEQGLMIVSYGEYLPWADRNIIIDPENFISYFRNASCVVTNTYHGTIFSIIYNKPFYSFAYNSQKVKDLLNAFGLQERLPKENNSVSELLAKAPDYDLTNQLIRENREISMAYIRDSLATMPLKK